MGSLRRWLLGNDQKDAEEGREDIWEKRAPDTRKTMCKPPMEACLQYSNNYKGANVTPGRKAEGKE